MKRLLATIRPSLLALVAIAAISLAGTALANRAIRDNSINTRDIKDNQVNSRDVRNNSLTTRDIRDNQVNTRDLRDGALRGVDVHDGSLGLADLEPGAVAELGRARLFDPRAHGVGGTCCLSWPQGPSEIGEVAASASDPIPNPGSGRAWREIVLDPGAYAIEANAYAQAAAAGSEAAVTRFFLGGHPVGLGGGYSYLPAESGPIPVPHSASIYVEVPNGSADRRRLVERVASLAAAARLADELLIWEVRAG